MVSLLFIANSPAVDGVKSALQKLLKVRIDGVADFDHGLKDVFEKRPSIVCIQEQIQGVTGESVARHIQMLLGASAPAFIVVHETGSRIKPIKGLFEYLIDLNQPPEKILSDMMAILKSLLGDTWESLCIAPERKTASERAAAILPLESREFADQLVDDLISDLDSFGPVDKKQDVSELNKPEECPIPPNSAPESIAKEKTDEGLHFETPSDWLFVVSAAEESAEMAIENNSNVMSAKESKPDASIIPPEKSALTDIPLQQPTIDDTVADEVLSEPVGSTPKGASIQVLDHSKSESIIVSDNNSEIKSKAIKNSTQQPEIKEVTPIVSKPADFTVSKGSDAQEEIPEDLLLEFEKNFRSQSASSSKIIAISVAAILALGVGGWYLVKKKPNLIFTAKKNPPVVSQSAPTPAKPAVSAAALVQKQHSSRAATAPVDPQAVQKNPLTQQTANVPGFIPLKGFDASYSAKKPGWERYIGSTEEFRLFRADGKIKALQVLSRKGGSIPEARFTSILKDITGNKKFNVVSNENKLGFKVSKGSVSGGSEVLVYRKNGTVRAFVISLN